MIASERSELKTVRRILRAVSELHVAGLHQTAEMLTYKLTGETGALHVRRDLRTGEARLWNGNDFIASSSEPI